MSTQNVALAQDNGSKQLLGGIADAAKVFVTNTTDFPSGGPELVGVKGEDGNTIAGPTNQFPVKDLLAATEMLPDQFGAGGVLTFNLTQPADFVIVEVDNTDTANYVTYRCRVTLDGSDPASNLGLVARSGQGTSFIFPVSGSVIKVFAPTGVVVAVETGRYG